MKKTLLQPTSAVPPSRILTLLPGILHDKPAGLPNSVLQRCTALNSANVEVVLLVPAYNRNHSPNMASLRSAGRLSKGTFVHNLYDDLKSLSNTQSFPLALGRRKFKVPKLTSRFTRSSDIQVDPGKPWIERVYVSGKYVEFRQYENRQREQLQFVDLLSDGKRHTRIGYNSSGKPDYVQAYSSDSESSLRTYIDTKSQVFLIESVNPTGKITNYEVLTKDGLTSLPSLSELIKFWLGTCFQAELNNGILISEYAFHQKQLEELANDYDTSVIYTFHNNHYASPHRYGSPFKPELVSFLNNMHTMDAVVVLTDEQKLDLQKRFQKPANIVVIPHAVPPKALEVPSIPIERDPNLIVMIGRLAKEKGHRAVIENFHLLLAKVPAARLEIYGHGPESGTLQALIDELDLSNSVSLKGFTHSVAESYRSAAISLFPSDFEGHPLALIEACAFGAVPVAYNFKYGAQAMIRNGHNGILVDPSGIVELLDSAALLLTDNDLWTKFNKELTSTDVYTPSDLADNWLDLFSTL